MNYLRNKKGASSVITALLLTVIMGFAALVIDVGIVYIERVRLSNTADAAVLAGAQELPSYPLKAQSLAMEYCKKNDVNLSDVNIIISEDKRSMEVHINKEVNYIFAKVLGFETINVAANSRAVIGPVSAVYEGIRPIVVEKQLFQYGHQVVLKEDAGDGMSGNYGVVSLGGNGSTTYESNIKYGFNGKLSVGDIINTETGNMSGSTVKGVDFINSSDYDTFENHSRDSFRIWTIPVIDSLNVSGKKSVTVIGFAQFFVENAYKNGGHTEIIGRFMKFTTNGDIDPSQPDTGLYGVKLVR